MALNVLHVSLGAQGNLDFFGDERRRRQEDRVVIRNYPRARRRLRSSRRLTRHHRFRLGHPQSCGRGGGLEAATPEDRKAGQSTVVAGEGTRAAEVFAPPFFLCSFPAAGGGDGLVAVGGRGASARTAGISTLIGSWQKEFWTWPTSFLRKRERGKSLLSVCSFPHANYNRKCTDCDK